MSMERENTDFRIDAAQLLGSVWRRRYRIIIVTLISLALTYAVLMFVPKMYESSASLLVEPRSELLLSLEGEGSTGIVADDATISSEIALIQSRDTLLQVIDAAGLRDEAEFTGLSSGLLGLVTGLFSRSSATNLDAVILANLVERLTVVRERDSRIISIYVQARSPELAARVANAVAETHVSRRAGLVIEDTADASQWLEPEIEKLRQRVTEAEAAVAAYKVDNDLFVGDNSTSLLDQQLSDIAAQISEAQARKSEAQSRASVLRSLIDGGQAIEGHSAVQESITIQSLAEEKARLQGERAQKLATLLPSHPSIEALTAQIAEIDSQIVAEARRIADSLEAEVEIEGRIEQSLRDELARLKLDASAASKSGVTLAALEREAAAQRQLLEAYLLRYREATALAESNSALPHVRIVSVAAPSRIPASPQTKLILAAVGFLALFGQIGYILFADLVSGQALVRAGAGRAEPALAEEEPQEISAETEAAAMASSQAQSAPMPVEVSAPELVSLDDLMPSADTEPGGDEEPAFEEDSEAMVGASGEVAEPVAPEPLEPAAPEPPALEETEAPAPEEPVLAESVQMPPVPALPQSAEEGSDPFAALFAARQAAAEEETARESVSAAPAADSEAVEAEEDHAVPQEQHAETETGREERPPAERQIPHALQAVVDNVVAGGKRIVFVATLSTESETQQAVSMLAAEAAGRGISLALVDGSSGTPTAELGLTDLCAGRAGFGDIVYRMADGNTARVPWGQQERLDHRSAAGLTLVQALSDIFEMLVVTTGRPGIASSLPLFSGAEGELLMISARPVSAEVLAGIEADAAALGFAPVLPVALTAAKAEVA